MQYDYKKVPEIIKTKETFPSGANTPTITDIHKCFCGKGKIEHERVPGFDDDFITVKCRECSKKYKYVETAGYEWRVYFD